MTTTIDVSGYPLARVLAPQSPSIADQIVAVIHTINERFATDWTTVSGEQLAFVLGGFDALVAVLDLSVRTSAGTAP